MMRGFLVAVSLLSVAAGFTHAGDLEPGLQQSQFVTKQHISSPTGISVSPQGVAFVSCDPNGLTNDKRGAGRVVRCEDTDGDGRADRFSTFVAGIDSPRGSCYVDDTLYLMQSPSLVAYQDTDGDGVADKHTTLVTNLGPSLAASPVIHGPNGVRMGIDGWLYLAIGDQGCFTATGTDGSQATLHDGGVLRVRPDGSRLGVVAVGTRNIYGIAVDPYLDLFARDNTNDGGGWGTRLHHLTELANFGYPRLYRHFAHEAMPSLADYGAGAGTGMYYLHEPGFPGELGNTLYSGDFNTGLWRHPRQPHEATWQVRHQRFMNAPNTIGIDVDGFSRIYSASRAGGGFGFASEPFGHVDLIQPADRAAAAAYPDINKAGDADLLAHLASPSQVTRINAMREIVTRGSRPTFTTGLRSRAADPQAPLFARVAAIMTLKQLEGVKSHAVLKELYQDAAVREFVVRALGDVEGEIDGIGKELCLQALRDDNPRVQLRAIIGLARSRDAGVAAAILPLAADQKLTAAESGSGAAQPGADGWSAPHRTLGHTALKAVVHLNAVDLLLSTLDDPALREAALRGLQEIHGQRVVAGLTAKVANTNDARLAELITLALFRLYHREVPWDGVTWWGNRPNFTGPYYNRTEWEQTPAVRAALQASFRKVDPARYGDLFRLMRMHQVPERELALDIKYDEALSLLSRKTLTPTELTFVMESATDPSRPEHERLQIYEYIARGPLPDSYHNRAYILRKWGERKADGKLLRQAYADFVGGKEFIGRYKEWTPFLGDENRESYKYAHLQLLNLLNESALDAEAKAFLAKELEQTWSSPKGLHRALRLRGLILAFEEIDPAPYAERLKPLVDYMDEHVKQGSARILKAIGKAADPEKKPE
jgi:glucose/arabinose dehydrogenase